MNVLKAWLTHIVDLWHSVKDSNLRWQTDNREQVVQLRHAHVLAEKALEAELKKRSVQLEHEITLLRTKNDAVLAMYKTKCSQDVKDYKQYLEALNQLKRSIQRSYVHLPEAVAFTIHHHAKYLLNKMWEAEDFEEKMQYEIRLIKFMTTVHEDARLYLEGVTSERFPENTLSLIQEQ